MKKTVLITLITALFTVAVLHGAYLLFHRSETIVKERLRVGFLLSHDESDPYACNVLRDADALEEAFGGAVTVSVKVNVKKEAADEAISALVADGCDLIFSAEPIFADGMKALAAAHPGVQFCCAFANADGTNANFHSFSPRIREGAYVTGVIAGQKIREMIDGGKLAADKALIGFLYGASDEGAFPVTDSAFAAGVRSVAPEAVFTAVRASAPQYECERIAAKELIDEGCLILVPYTETAAPVEACEKAGGVFLVSADRTPLDMAPTTALAAFRVNCLAYMTSAAEAVRLGIRIESNAAGTVSGNDVSAGFDREWLAITEINRLVAPTGAEEAAAKAIEQIKRGTVAVDIDTGDTFLPSLGA